MNPIASKKQFVRYPTCSPPNPNINPSPDHIAQHLPLPNGAHATTKCTSKSACNFLWNLPCATTEEQVLSQAHHEAGQLAHYHPPQQLISTREVYSERLHRKSDSAVCYAGVLNGAALVWIGWRWSDRIESPWSGTEQLFSMG